MKSSQILWAIGFLGFLLIIVGGLWVVNLFMQTGSEPGAGGGRGAFGSLFPFGRGSSSDVSVPADEDEFNAGTVPRLRKVSDVQVAGARFASGLTGVPSVRYVERETGNVLEAPVDSYTTTRITNTTIPRVAEAVWLSASSTVLRFVTQSDTIENFSAYFTSTSSDQSLEGGFLDGYRSVSATPDGGVLGVLETVGGSRVELITPKLTRSVLLESPIASWIPLAAGKDSYLISAPSGTTLGSLYRIEKGGLRTVVPRQFGLSAVARPDGERFLVSSSERQVAVAFIVNKEGVVLYAPERSTLAQKCGWVGATDKVVCAIPKSLPRGLYPDEWLIGNLSTNDELWLFDTTARTQTLLMDLEAEAQTPLDVSQVSVSEDGRYVAFINKPDQTLWVATLTPQ